MSGVLEPLAGRYVEWLRVPAAATADVAAEEAELVRAMPVVLRIERDEPPGRTPMLEAAAAAAVGVCLDPRAEPGGEWHDDVAAWVGGRIRKVARRARGAHWAAVQALPGMTVAVGGTAVGGTAVGGTAVGGVAVGGAEVRALVPGRVVETPKEVSRLQITGSDLPADEPGPPPPGIPVLWLNPAIEMSAGKAAAQVGHATMLLASLLPDVSAWAADGFRVAVRTPTRERWAELHPGDDLPGAWRSRGIVVVRDAGFTEIAPGTVTVLAQRA